MSILNQAPAQSWVDSNLYPFESHFLNLPAGKMHYVDEGEGEVILFVHGTPTWSILYREFIREFSKTHRCIAIDHLGFGLSEKPENFSGTPYDHAENLRLLVNELKLDKVTLVVHDFGGPIGLGWALREPQKVKQVIMFNTWLWSTQSIPEAQKADKMINSWLGRFLYLHLNISPKVLLKKGFADKSSLTKNLHQQYKKPFHNSKSRLGLYRIAQSLVGASGWYQQLWQKLDRLENKHWLILWGMEDEFLKPGFLEKWQERLPDAQITKFNCGHFVQEEKAQEAIKEMKRFLQPAQMPHAFN